MKDDSKFLVGLVVFGGIIFILIMFGGPLFYSIWVEWIELVGKIDFVK